MSKSKGGDKPAQKRWSWGEYARPSGGATGGSGWYNSFNWGTNTTTWEDYDPIRDGTQVIDHHGYDRVVAGRVIGGAGKLGTTLAPYRHANPTTDALGRDIFWSLYKRAVKKMDVPLQDAYQINGELIGEMMDGEDYPDLHATTQGDQFLAEMAADKLAPTILSTLSQETTERIRRQKEMSDQLAQLQARAAELEELHGEQPNELLRKGLDETTVSIEELQRQIEELRGRLSDEERAALRKALQGQLTTVIEQVESVQQGFEALGGQLGGGKGLAYAQGVTAAFARNKLDNAKKASLALRLLKDKKLRMIAELAGRMSEIAWQVQNSKSPEPTDELTDTRQGHDIARLLSSEMAYLSDPDLELIFLHRYVNDQLMSYQIEGYTPLGRGPLIVMIDNSGSMSGEPEQWSKAVMLALRMIAEKQKRDFITIHFDSTVQMVDEFPKGMASPEKMLKNIEFFSGGGTNFEPPMREAMKFIRRSKYGKADTIFVTDGLCGIRDEECRTWNEARAKAGMHSYCILIGSDQWGRGVMERLTDKMMTVDPEKLMAEHTDTSSDVLQTVFGV